MSIRTAEIGLALMLLTATPAASYEGFPQTTLPHQAWNIGAGDLLNPATAACALGVYLDELTALGGPRQIRIVYTPGGVGSFVRQHWMPVIREKGFRVLVILSGSSYEHNLSAQQAWIAGSLPPIADILDGVQLANEVNRMAYNTMGPKQYRRWHRQMAAWVRDAAPGVPILSPDLHDPESKAYIRKTKLIYGVDFDVYSLHTTDYPAVKRWKWARDHAGIATPRAWITEGRPHHLTKINADHQPPRIERLYVYVWNCNPDHPGQESCSKHMRRPGGEDVPQCEGASREREDSDD